MPFRQPQPRRSLARSGGALLLRGLDSPPDDIEWCRALVLLHLHDTSFAALQAVENKDGTQLMVDGWEHRALLLELLRMFGHQLALGPAAKKLVDHQSARDVRGIRKPSSGHALELAVS